MTPEDEVADRLEAFAREMLNMRQCGMLASDTVQVALAELTFLVLEQRGTIERLESKVASLEGKR